MGRTRLLLYLYYAAGAALLVSGPAYAQRPPLIAGVDEPSPFVATNPTLHTSLQRIASQSSLWRDAAESIKRSGRRAVIVPSDQVVVAAAAGRRATDSFDPTVLAEVAPIVRGDASIDVVLVVVNLALLEEQHREQQLPPIEFERDLDRILVHEIYGHAVPYLLVGHVSGRCADPQPQQRAADACSIQRENAVRAELGLGRRVDSGLQGLSLSRRNRY